MEVKVALTTSKEGHVFSCFLAISSFPVWEVMFKRILKAFLVNLNSFYFVLHVALQAFGHGKDQKNTRWSAHLMLWHSQEMLVSNLNHKSLITRKKHWSERLKKSQSQQTETLRIYCKVEVGVSPQQMPSHKDRAWKGTWNSLKLPGDGKKTDWVWSTRHHHLTDTVVRPEPGTLQDHLHNPSEAPKISKPLHTISGLKDIEGLT